MVTSRGNPKATKAPENSRQRREEWAVAQPHDTRVVHISKNRPGIERRNRTARDKNLATRPSFPDKARYGGRAPGAGHLNGLKDSRNTEGGRACIQRSCKSWQKYGSRGCVPRLPNAQMNKPENGKRVGNADSSTGEKRPKKESKSRNHRTLIVGTPRAEGPDRKKCDGQLFENVAPIMCQRHRREPKKP